MYSQRLTELFHSRAHGGKLDSPTHIAEAGTPGQGPYMRLGFQVRDGVVEIARWKTYGCPAAIACAEAACAWSEGKPLTDLADTTPEQVIEWVGGVPEGKEHCPDLAARGLRCIRPV